MPHHQFLPDLYRLLAVFSGIPIHSVPALEAARLRVPVTNRYDPKDPGNAPISDMHRALFRELATSGRIRWVKWPRDVQGYVLTGYGEAALDIYQERYGPAHTPRRGPPLSEIAARNRQRDELVRVLQQRLEGM